MFNFYSENTFTAPITQENAQELIHLRSIYDYPRAYIGVAEGDNYDFQLDGNMYCSYTQPTDNLVSDLWLDTYHTNLLRSENGGERLLGLASVLYWGYYTFNHNYARVRVERMINGYGNYPAITTELATEKLEAIIPLLENGAIGEAIGTLAGLSQLNRTPFASKIIAFISPSTSGIYDNRINSGVKNEPWACQFKNGIGNIASLNIQKKYQSWCSLLSLIASQLNLGIALGNEWRWSCGIDINMSWRALDVERALFANYA